MATRLTRDKLKLFLPSQELIVAFEDIDKAARQTNPADIIAAQATADAALELATAERLGVFDQRPRVVSIRAGDGIQVTPDAAGFVVTVDLYFLVNALLAFLPKQQPPAMRPDDAQAILANKIFGRH